MKEAHPVCRQMRQLRKAVGWSLLEAERQLGVNSLVIGSYERGDRNCSLVKAEEILNGYGYTLAAVPKDFEAIRLTGSIVRELRNIANQLEEQARDDVS